MSSSKMLAYALDEAGEEEKEKTKRQESALREADGSKAAKKGLDNSGPRPNTGTEPTTSGGSGGGN